jgi:hypothetical protein
MTNHLLAETPHFCLLCGQMAMKKAMIPELFEQEDTVK